MKLPIISCTLLLAITLHLCKTDEDGDGPSVLEGNSPLHKTKEVLEHVQTALEVTKEVVNSAAIKNGFMQLSKALSSLGPVFMAFSAIISIVSIFLPKEESAEMKALKKGFENVNGKLDTLHVAIKELKQVVEQSNAKIVVIGAIDAIDSLYREMEIAHERKSKVAWNYFGKRFENEFLHSTDTLYKTLYGSAETKDFRFDYLEIFKEKTKCAPQSIAQFCITSLQLLNKGLAVEAAYLGAIRYPSRVKLLRIIWGRRLMKLRAKCAEMIDNCTNNWKHYAKEMFDEKGQTDTGELSNTQIALDLESELTQAFPFRRFGVFAGNKIGFDPFQAAWVFGNSVWHDEVSTPHRYLVVMSSPIDAPCGPLADALIHGHSYVESNQWCTHLYLEAMYYDATKPVINKIREKAGQESTVLGGPATLNGYLAANKKFSDRYNMHPCFCLTETYRFFAFC